MAYGQLSFDPEVLPPGEMSWPRVVSSSIGPGMSASGVYRSADISGGGLVAVGYNNIQLGNADQGRLRLWSRLELALAGSIRWINVTLLTDFAAPAARGATWVLSPHSDTAPFSDGSQYAQPPVSGEIVGAAVAGAGELYVRVIGGTGVCYGGEWFGLLHPTKGPRAYGITDILDSSVDSNGNNVYRVAIRPTLREAVADGAQADFWRPKCLMMLDPATKNNMSIRDYWYSTPSIGFIEYFGAYP
jgi:hypothetical protein